MTLCIMDFILNSAKMTLNIKISSHHLSHILLSEISKSNTFFFVILSVIKLSVVMLSGMVPNIGLFVGPVQKIGSDLSPISI